MTADLKAARGRYLQELPHYKSVAKQVVQRLKKGLFLAGVPFSIETRVKDESSLLKKMLLKGKSYDQIGDKAGVRVILAYPDDRDRTLTVIRRVLDVVAFDDKLSDVDPSYFSYTAVHMDVKLRRCRRPDIVNRVCELQVHTPGEALWAKLNHDITYKTLEKLPNTLKRAMSRVKALTELIDLETRAVRSAIDAGSTGTALNAVAALERAFLPIAQTGYDVAWSMSTVQALEPLLAQSLDSRLQRFLSKEDELVEYIYEQRNNLCFPFLTQPESLAVLMLLKENAPVLQDNWPAHLPEPWLYDLAANVGVGLSSEPL